MDLVVFHNGVDITNYVIEYTREQKMCSGIGTLQLSLSLSYSGTILTWDSFDLYEGSILKGNYFVNSVSDRNPEGTINIVCQDSSKRLTDYFISENYYIDYYTTTRTWVSKFLEDAGVDYEYNVSSVGTPISNNTSLGMMSAYEQITQLLQMSGWFMHFVGMTCIIGKTSPDSAASCSLGTEDILSITTNKSDKMLRNRAVVWGNGRAIGEETEWVFADLKKKTPYTTSSNDLRTAVISNGNIYSKADATNLANKMLQEFCKLNYDKSISVHGPRDIVLGQNVYVDTTIFTGIGVVTTVGSSLSESGGHRTNIILDERCPRLFAFYGVTNEYVYASTYGDGVYRKPLTGSGWTSYNSGLSDKRVTDLYKNNGILVCTTASGIPYYSDEYNGTWTPISISNLPYSTTGSGEYDSVYSGDLYARAVTLDRNTNRIRIAVDNRPAENSYGYGTLMSGYNEQATPLSWVVDCPPTPNPSKSVYQVVYSGATDFFISDIENDGRNDFVSVASPIGGTPPYSGVVYDYGEQENQLYYDTLSNYNCVTNSSLHIAPVTNSQLLVGDTTINTHDVYGNRCIATIQTLGGVPYLTVNYLNESSVSFETEYEIQLTGMKSIYGIFQDSKYVFTVFGNLSTSLTTYKFVTVDVLTGTLTSSATTSITGMTLGSSSNSRTSVFGYVLDDLVLAGYRKLILKEANLETRTITSRTVVDTSTLGLEHQAVITATPLIGRSAGSGAPVVLTMLLEEWTYLSMQKLKIYLLESTNGASSSIVKSSDEFIRTTAIATNLFAFYASPNTVYNPVSARVHNTNTIGPILLKLDYSSTSNVPASDTSFSGYTKLPTDTGGEMQSKLFLRRNSDNTIWVGDAETQSIDFQLYYDGYTVNSISRRLDSTMVSLWAYGKRNSDSKYGIIQFGINGAFTRFIPVTNINTTIYSFSNNFLTVLTTTSTYLQFYIGDMTTFNGSSSLLPMVFRRDGSVFSLAHGGSGLDRLEISNLSPVLVVESGMRSSVILESFSDVVRETTLSGYSTYSGPVYDFRYNDSASEETGTLLTNIVYTTSSGLFKDSLSTDYLIVSSTLYFTPSGTIPVNQVETSTKQSPEQYIFVSVSGQVYQSDPEVVAFVETSTGLPGTMITRIRLDDRI